MKKKRLLILAFAVTLSLFGLMGNTQIASADLIAEPWEEKVYCAATLSDDFEDDTVLVVLNKAASSDFKAYTPKDFPEVACERVTDLTEPTADLIQRQRAAERSGD
ncbi:MAG: hypothetical protein FWD58_09845 [Firmicutes bacterium]|nr:hypothetical protein [Bacillota bacterium]